MCRFFCFFPNVSGIFRKHAPPLHLIAAANPTDPPSPIFGPPFLPMTSGAFHSDSGAFHFALTDIVVSSF
jgi:hypothetical protein